MSRTSCFKYVVEIPEPTLSGLLRGVIAQGETAPVPITFHEEDRPIDGYLVTVDASVTDSDEEPAALDLLAANLEAVLRLHADLRATVQDLDGLDPIEYRLGFGVPATIGVDTARTPPWLVLGVGALTASDLDATITGGDLHYTAALFEGPVHEFFATSDLDQIVENVTLAGLSKQARAYLHDTAADPITVSLPTSDRLRITFPGELEIWTVANPQHIESAATMTIAVEVPIQITTDAGTGNRKLSVMLSEVESSDVTVSLSWLPDPYPSDAINSPPFYAPLVPGLMAPKIVTRLHAIPNPERQFPSEAEVRDMISTALAELLSDTSWPMIPLDGGDTEFDLAAAVPATIDAAVLALQIEPEDIEPAPCVGPEDFTGTWQLATAISDHEVNRRLAAVADSVNGMEIQVEGYDVTLNRPSLSLADPGEHDQPEGHIWAEGTAVVHVGGCVGDVDASYHGPITLRPVTEADGTVRFEVIAGEFAGDTDAKDKKEDWDPNVVSEFLAAQDWDFPVVPTRFEGLGNVSVDFNEAQIDRQGIRLGGGVTITLLNALMYSTVLPISTIWAMERAGGG